MDEEAPPYITIETEADTIATAFDKTAEMKSLPVDSLRQIGDYLCAKDIRSFSCTSKRIRKQISLCSTTPRMFIDFNYAFEGDGNDDNFHYGFDMPIPTSTSNTAIHSVRFSFKWRDQGWGNRKGGIQLHTNDGEVVYNSGFAHHRLNRRCIDFKVSPNKTYQLHYRVGGGGGHMLILHECNIQLLLLGDKLDEEDFPLLPSPVIPWWERRIKVILVLSFIIIMPLIVLLAIYTSRRGGGPIGGLIIYYCILFIFASCCCLACYGRYG